MPGLVPGIHVFVTRKKQDVDGIGSRACPTSVQRCAASRIYPTCGAKPGHDGGEAGPYGKYPRQLICCATGSDVATLFHRNSRTGRSIEQPPEVEGRKLILRVLADVSCEGPNCAWIDGF